MPGLLHDQVEQDVQLARLELNVAFKMLYDRYPDIVSDGDPVLLRSNFVNGIKHLPATYTP